MHSNVFFQLSFAELSFLTKIDCALPSVSHVAVLCSLDILDVGRGRETAADAVVEAGGCCELGF